MKPGALFARFLFSTFLPYTAVPLTAPAYAQRDGDHAPGQMLTEEFRQGRLTALWHRMTPEMQSAIGSEQKFDQLRQSILAQFGGEVALISQQAMQFLDLYLYWRIAIYEKGSAPLITQWAVDKEGRVSGFYVRLHQKPAASRFADEGPKIRLHLPFAALSNNGQWYVYWGGRTIEDNYHAANVSERFAYDFVIARDGKSHVGDGKRLDDYHCWGQPILAPASGTVVQITEALPDNPIGTTDKANPGGNHVVLRLGDKRYAFFAHLQRGSVRVLPGQKLHKGQEIGQCGNSGNSSEPHLHFHIQTTPVIGTGEGRPAFFRDYIADGDHIETGEPLRGQSISPLPAPR
ncbi:MAG: M23 family peptidase [Sphingobium sp.]|nr:M23 family peptidase [Sphingobium sp.]